MLKALPNTFPTKMKPIKCPAKEKKIRKENQKKRRGKKAKRKSEDCCVTFKPEKFCFLRVPELCRLIFLTWANVDQKAAKVLITCKQLSLRSWRYCVGAKFWRRSRVPKKGSRDEAVDISRGFAARDGSTVKSHSTILQRLHRQISLDYYTMPPATQAILWYAYPPYVKPAIHSFVYRFVADEGGKL